MSESTKELVKRWEREAKEYHEVTAGNLSSASATLRRCAEELAKQQQEDRCDDTCIDKADEQLKKIHLQLRQHITMDTKTLEPGRALALETVSQKKGVKAQKIFMSFCPFCGRKNR